MSEINLKGHYLDRGGWERERGRVHRTLWNLRGSILALRRVWCNRTISHRLLGKKTLHIFNRKRALLSFWSGCSSSCHPARAVSTVTGANPPPSGKCHCVKSYKNKVLLPHQDLTCQWITYSHTVCLFEARVCVHLKRSHLIVCRASVCGCTLPSRGRSA